MFSTVDSALKAMKRGHPIVVSDSEARENEGDFILPAAAATAEVIGFINRYSSGVICAPMHQRRADALDLPPMVSMNTDPKRTAFTVSVDAVDGTTTGISAGDRAATLRALADPCASPGWFSRPGHIFPLVDLEEFSSATDTPRRRWTFVRWLALATQGCWSKS